MPRPNGFSPSVGARVAPAGQVCPDPPTDWDNSAQRDAWIAANPTCPVPPPVLAPIAPNPLTPVDNAAMTAGSIVFAFNPPPHGEQFFLYVCSDESGNNCLVDDTKQIEVADLQPGIKGIRTTIPPGNYYWWLRAKRADGAGGISPASPSRKIVVSAPAAGTTPDVPTTGSCSTRWEAFLDTHPQYVAPGRGQVGAGLGWTGMEAVEAFSKLLPDTADCRDFVCALRVATRFPPTPGVTVDPAVRRAQLVAFANDYPTCATTAAYQALLAAANAQPSGGSPVTTTPAPPAPATPVAAAPGPLGVPWWVWVAGGIGAAYVYSQRPKAKSAARRGKK